MNGRILRLALATVLAASAFAVLAPAVRSSDPTTVEMAAPAELQIGDQAEVSVIVRDSIGRPLPRVPVVLRSAGTFLGTDGAVRLGASMTDSQGHAVFAYQARTEGPVVLTAHFDGDAQHSPAFASTGIAIHGSAQLYSESAGVRVPGVGVWLLVAILGGVWSTYLAVMVFLTLIARGAPRARAVHASGEGHG